MNSTKFSRKRKHVSAPPPISISAQFRTSSNSNCHYDDQRKRMQDTSNALSYQIREEIRLRGPISFARFMELALYAPGLGYYERRREIGRAGDFFTSVSVGPLFGELLAFQFVQWMDMECPEGGIQFIEAGPHDGRLAADILAWTSRHRPDVFARLEYYLLDASPARRTWQEETLRSWLAKVKWAARIEELGERQVSGIIFSNEFLDALPVHRLAWSAARREWQEACVTVEGEAFAWAWRSAEGELTEHLPQTPVELAAVLPDGFMLEVCPAATAWWRAAASSLRRGKLLTIDYGLAHGEWFQPARAQGTLRAFTRHHASADLLSQPGEQDLTAHVNFSALIEAGQAIGLRTEGLTTQFKFLTEILTRTRLAPDSFETWNEKRTRQFQTLTHPEHLGHKFQVLIQAR
jgi:SAM-dependent MidA family methyltransferase